MIKAQTKKQPLTPQQWGAELRKALAVDFQTHDDPLIRRLSADKDTSHHVAEHVRHYVTDYWKEANKDRSLRGAEMKQMLTPAIAAQKTTIRIFEKAAALIEAAGLDPQEPARINAYAGLEKAQDLLAQLESMRDHAPATFNTKSLGYKGDLQILYSLHCLLRYRLGNSSFDTLATLIDCGHAVEGHAKEDFGSGENLRKRLENFCEKHAPLAKQTEAAVRHIPRK